MCLYYRVPRSSPSMNPLQAVRFSNTSIDPQTAIVAVYCIKNKTTSPFALEHVANLAGDLLLQGRTVSTWERCISFFRISSEIGGLTACRFTLYEGLKIVLTCSVKISDSCEQATSRPGRVLEVQICYSPRRAVDERMYCIAFPGSLLLDVNRVVSDYGNLLNNL